MMQFRYVIKSHPCGWQDMQSISLEQLNFNYQRMSAWYGEDWYIEYR